MLHTRRTDRSSPVASLAARRESSDTPERGLRQFLTWRRPDLGRDRILTWGEGLLMWRRPNRGQDRAVPTWARGRARELLTWTQPDCGRGPHSSPPSPPSLTFPCMRDASGPSRVFAIATML